MPRPKLDPKIKAANRKKQQEKAYNDFMANGGKEKVALRKKQNDRGLTLNVKTKAKFMEAKEQAGLTADKFMNYLLDK